jgi:hypothetical protein
VTLYDSVNAVLKRLDDYPALSGESVWTRAEIELYLEDGYNVFARQTKAIFDFFYPENIPTTGNYVAAWERGYYEPGMIANGLIGFTGGYWERDYGPAGAVGPINHTQPWESEYIETTFALGSKSLPQDVVAVERATHDYHQLNPEFTRFFEQNDRDYETGSGEPWRFSMDRDGISRLRVVPTGSGNAETVEVSGTWGLLRTADDDEFGTWGPNGEWGVLREIPEHFPMGGQYGIPRRMYLDTANTRIEYARLGKDWTQYGNELPPRFRKHLEFYACARALERDGPGQDMKLSQHFAQRFDVGVRRVILRLTEHRRAVSGRVGGTSRVPTSPALARLPWRYGRQIRRAY